MPGTMVGGDGQKYMLERREGCLGLCFRRNDEGRVEVFDAETGRPLDGVFEATARTIDDPRPATIIEVTVRACIPEQEANDGGE